MSLFLNGGGSHARIEPLTTWVDEIICQVIKELKEYLSSMTTSSIEDFISISTYGRED